MSNSIGNQTGNFLEESIVEEAIANGEIGLCVWQVEEDKVILRENITGYSHAENQTIDTLIRKVVYHKDQELAFQDLGKYRDQPKSSHLATFRIKTKDKTIKWIIFKGRFVPEENIVTGIIYDVTDSNMRSGHDPLTKLINYDFFIRKLKNSIKERELFQNKGSLAAVSIENYKELTNTYDFETVEDVLKTFAQLIKGLMPPLDELACFSDDTFMILTNDFHDGKEVENLCYKIHEACKSGLLVKNYTIYLKISIGVTVFPDDSKDIDDLMKFAKFAVTQAEQRTGSSYKFFDKRMSDAYHRRVYIESELPNAIHNDEFYLCYQPQIELSSQRFYGFEALLRWNNNALGPVSPGEFIPIAETKGYIIDIGYWVLMEAVKRVRKLLDEDYDFETMAINISPIQIRQNDFRENLINLCEKYQVPHSMIELELTEGLLLKAAESNVNKLNALYEDGFKIALDDFGTGYSNLSTLQQFKITTLKIQKSLIDHIEDEKHAIIVESIAGVAKKLNYNLIAEGVERKEQLEILVKLGFDTIQGFYFSKPILHYQIGEAMEKLALKFGQ